VGRVLAFEAAMIQFVKTKQSALVSSILSKKELDADGEKTLAAAIAEFKKSWA
jgi:F-type H+-transporting ATPase subunit alpha